jgi:hypothetical protein
MKPHYFQDEKPDKNDLRLLMAKQQGYVPAGCLLGGFVVVCEISRGKDPCAGCNGPRARCGGRERGTRDV